MMDREDLDDFGKTVINFDLCPADLDAMGAKEHFNSMLKAMDQAYTSKNEKEYFSKRKYILALLSQIASAKQREAA